jgi:hypothetical protein
MIIFDHVEFLAYEGKSGVVGMMFIVFGEIILGYLVYRKAKANGTLPEPRPKAQEREPHVSKPLPPNATRLQKIAHWLGLEETED